MKTPRRGTAGGRAVGPAAWGIGRHRAGPAARVALGITAAWMVGITGAAAQGTAPASGAAPVGSASAAAPASIASAAAALDPAAVADHEALRRLKADLEQAVSKRDFALLGRVVQQPFMATLVTQDSFRTLPDLQRHYDGLFTRDFLRLKDVRITAEADELSEILTGTVALTRGSTQERYELADGRAFDMQGRWTAVSVRQPDGQWKLWGIHGGVDFLDNPVLLAIEKSVVWTGVAGLGAGLLAGLVAGWWVFGRRRRG